MGKVNILPADIISKIAAGEVIERPCSVVKELVENSLDAGTGSVELHLKQAGKAMIHVKDTGSGIARDDLEKIFLRHATSKIRDINDLFNISSLGFRGEALYSIAAISDVVLRSRIKDEDTGWEIHLRDGKNLGIKPVNMRLGTEVEVKELFFNTPARRKFLKTDTTELNQIVNTFMPYTMLYPEARFLLTHYGKTLLDLAPDESLVRRLARALHIKEENIIETYKNAEGDDISMRIFLGDINIQRAKRDMQYIFVNDRPVQNRGLSFHLNDVYRLVFPQGVYPFFAAYIQVPPENVDVNIHPTKREVKINNDRKLVYQLRRLCEHALMSLSRPKKIKEMWASPDKKRSVLDGNKLNFNLSDLEKPSGEKLPITTGGASSAPFDRPGFDKTNRIKEALAEETQALLSRAGSAEKTKQYVLFKGTKEKFDGFAVSKQGTLTDKLTGARYIGAFLKKYLFFEAPPSLLVIDQHAAQERVTYEKLINQINSKQIEVQRLLTPMVMRLSIQEMNSWEETKDKLESIGISTTQWDKESIALHSHPQLIPSPEISLRNILAGEDTARCDKETLARWACRRSIMAGDDVKKEGAEYLRAELLKCKDPFTCPHGRPTVVEMDEKFLNRQFLRG